LRGVLVFLMDDRLPQTAVMKKLIQRLTEIRKAADGLWHEYQILLRQEGRGDDAYRKLKAYQFAMSEWKRVNVSYKAKWKHLRHKNSNCKSFESRKSL